MVQSLLLNLHIAQQQREGRCIAHCQLKHLQSTAAEKNFSPETQSFLTKASSTAHHNFGGWFGGFGCGVGCHSLSFGGVCFVWFGGFFPKPFSKEVFFLLLEDDEYFAYSLLT